LDDVAKRGFNSLLPNSINSHCYCETKKDECYKEALQRSDILIPDGIGIVWAVRILTGQKIKHIAGADLHKYILQQLNASQGKVFYMGSTLSMDMQQKAGRLVKIISIVDARNNCMKIVFH
jgi:UDP-N-acetyl-D-mannosaminuronic acid transferase (WecB/TagA/CpsF family)